MNEAEIVPTLPKTPSEVSETSPTNTTSAIAKHIGRYRWVICGLLFFATTVNYVDRQVLGILSKDLKQSIGWSEVDYGNIVASFNTAYAFGLLIAGRLMDRVGTKLGYSLAIIWWSLAAMAHALARTPIGFGIARASLGIGEAGNFPAAIKTVAEWFPKKERAFATGIFNAGSNVGAVVAPLTVPWIAINWGWQWAFIFTGAIGLVWLAFWIPLYAKPEQHPRVSRAELAHIQSDPPDPPAAKVPWVKLIPRQQTSAFAIGKYLTDPIWWFYLYWIPPFLRDKHGLDLTTIGPPLIAIYLIADVGSVGGGWLSSAFIKRGWTINRARKIAMLICALCVTPIAFVPHVRNLWGVVALIGLAAAAHQGWSCNLFTTTSDMFPRRAVGSVVGIGGMAGALGGATIAVAIGYILQTTGQNYTLVFSFAASIYLVALLVIHLLAPRLEQVEDIEAMPSKPLSVGTFVGFGFIGLIFGSFVGWCLGLISRVGGQSLLEYMVLAGLVGALVGVIVGFLTVTAGHRSQAA
ncbi:MAG TPA: MFS transporter [Pyrinomonadaceae bacterium]|jgi:ACS family hexuronate transporter-like MFS transporter|nr:MFS transporter [Pyrinomonadaceae bacterium]